MSGLGGGTIVLLSVWSLWLLAACEQLGFHRARGARSRWPVTVRLEPSVTLKPGWPARLSAVAAALGLVLVPTSLAGWRAYLVVALAALAVIAAFAGGADAGQAQPAADQRPMPVRITNDQGRRLVLSSVSLAGALWLVTLGGGTYWDYVAEFRLTALIVIVVAVIVYGQILGVPELRRRRQAHREEIRQLRKVHQAGLAALMTLPTRRCGYCTGAHAGAASDNGAARDNDDRHHGEVSTAWAGEESWEGGAPATSRAGSGPRWPGANGQAPPDSDRASVAPVGRAGPPGPSLTWAYYVPGDGGDQAGTGDGPARRGRMRLAASGDRGLPPEAAAAFVRVRLELDGAAAELPDGFEDWLREDQLRLVGEIARHSSGRWPLVLGAAAGGEDVPSETVWAVFFAPASADARDGTAPAAPRPGARTPRRPAAAPRGDSAQDAPPEHGTSQTILLLDTLAIDTLLAAMLGRPGPAPAGVGELRVIKIIIQPRGLAIMAVKIAVNAFLNAHGLGVLAPACGRVTTKILQAVLDYLLGPDRRFAELKKVLDAFEEFLYLANGRPADSQKLRDQFARWVAAGPSPHQDPTSRASATGWEPGYRASADHSRSASGGWYDHRARGPHDGPGRPAASPTASGDRAAPEPHPADRPTSRTDRTAPAASAAYGGAREASASGRKDAGTSEAGEVHGLRPSPDGTREPRTAGRDGAISVSSSETRDLAAYADGSFQPSTPSRDAAESTLGASEERGVLSASEQAREPGAAGGDALGGTPAARDMSGLHASDETPSRGARGVPGAAETRDHRTEPGGKHLPTRTGQYDTRGAGSRDYSGGPPVPRRSRRVSAPTAEGRMPRVASPDDTTSTREPYEAGDVSSPGERRRRQPADSPRELESSDVPRAIPERTERPRAPDSRYPPARGGGRSPY